MKALKAARPDARKRIAKKAASPKKAAAKKVVKKAAKSTTKGATKAASAPVTVKPAAIEAADALKTGQKAPAFRLPGDAGKNLALKDFAGKKLVIFFYPRANTPGCTREAIDFTRLKADFAKAGAHVIGVSADPPQAQGKFRDQHKLGVPLGSDETHAMLIAYGAWGQKSLYGRAYEGIIRSTVLIDAAGKIAQVWRNVKVEGHADAVLAAAKSL